MLSSRISLQVCAHAGGDPTSMTSDARARKDGLKARARVADLQAL